MKKMESQTFDYMLEEIYGAFGRQRPASGSPAYRAIERRVNGDERQLPDDCARFIAEAIADYDSLPTNLGKAIIGEFFNWLSENPKKRAAPFSCPECSSGLHGFFWAWDKDGNLFCLKCSCNRQPRFEKIPAFSHRLAMEAGYFLENPWMLNGGKIVCRPGWVRASLGGMGKPRPEHLR